MVWYDGDMKKILLTLGAVLSLFSYSSDPLALDVLDGKFMICTEFGNDLNQNLDPATYDSTNVGHDYVGFTFKGNKSYRWMLSKMDDPSVFFNIAPGEVERVSTQYIRWKMKHTSVYKGDYYLIIRKNLFLQKSLKNPYMNKSSFDAQFYCVLAKNKESYDNYMKKIQIKHKEKIDKDNADRKRKQIEEMKDNQI